MSVGTLYGYPIRDDSLPKPHEPAHLWLRFKCGHFRRLLSSEHLHYWLENARTLNCQECLQERAICGSQTNRSC